MVFSWDVMVSYRHASDKWPAETLARFIDEAGLRCWLDTRIIDQTKIHPRDDLKAVLRDAAEDARLVVGFPAADSLELHPDADDSRTAFSWLAWERQYARELLWVDQACLCSFPDYRLRFFFYPQLAYFVGLACGKAGDLAPFRQKYFGQMTPETRSAHGIEALHTLRVDWLPEIINPEHGSARRNVIFRSDLAKRIDIGVDHRMEILD